MAIEPGVKENKVGLSAERVVLIVLDSVGCGDAPDAAMFGDEGASTLSHIGEAVGGLNMPNLGRLGLGNITRIKGVPPSRDPKGAYGRLTEVSAGKDTTIGHWELAGLLLERPFPVYPDGFPDDLIHKFESSIGRGTLGNYPASGTEIIKDLGEEHMRTGKPIVYTSADSVFQIAAHEEVIPIEELYRMCRVARELLDGEHPVARVIARPFLGQSGVFTRTERRKDYSLDPPSDSLLDVLKSAGRDVIGVGKIEDIFVHRGLTASDHTGNNVASVDAILRFLRAENNGLIFANLVDFDALYGHRRDPRGYSDALEAFDNRLPEIIAAMNERDVLMITADHGADPTFRGTDHTRERVPIVIAGYCINPGTDIGTRSSFTDVAATVSELLDVQWLGHGESFASLIIGDS